MFISLPKTLGIFGSVLGVGGIGTVGVYATTKKTISDSLGEYRIVDKDKVENAWTKLEKRLKENDGTSGKQKPKSKVFVDLKDKSTEEGLKNLCQKSGEKVYWTIFSKDSDLMEDVKNFCSIKIFEVIEDGKTLDVEKTDSNNSNEDKYKSNLDVLKNHKVSEGKPKLDKDLTALNREMNKNSPDKNKLWKDLVKWCSKSYKSYFLNKEEDLWKNVETYCKKST